MVAVGFAPWDRRTTPNLGWLWLHFVDDRNGFALRIGSYETTPSQLWRTRDGGVRWSLVPLPNVPIR